MFPLHSHIFLTVLLVIFGTAVSHLQSHQPISLDPFLSLSPTQAHPSPKSITSSIKVQSQSSKSIQHWGEMGLSQPDEGGRLALQQNSGKMAEKDVGKVQRSLQQLALPGLTSILASISSITQPAKTANTTNTNTTNSTTKTSSQQLGYANIQAVLASSSQGNVSSGSHGLNYNFSNIVLSHGIPSNFLQNELFSFNGSVLVPNSSGTRVSIIFSRVSDGFEMVFSQTIAANQTTFTIPTLLATAGSYYLAIFTGYSGNAAQSVYVVHPTSSQPFSSNPPPTIQSANLDLIVNDLWLRWHLNPPAPPCITRVTFTQGNSSQLSYLLSNFQTAFQIPYPDFYSFKQGAVRVEISQAFSKSQSAFDRTSQFSVGYSLTFNAVGHQFAKLDSMNQLRPIPLRAALGGSILVSGVSRTNLLNEVLLKTPNNTFISYFIIPNASSNLVPANTPINITITLSMPGIYILEINNSSGIAIYNAPIYCGEIYPLTPDFIDLTPSQDNLTALSHPTSLRDRQLLVLALINKVRNAYNVSSLYLDDTLTSFAQNYSQAMVASNFIGHTDTQGRGLRDRLAARNTTFGVAENLALDMNLTEAELELQRSPAHLKSTVNPAWTRVGLGIAQSAAGYYYLAEEFSSRDMNRFPLTPQELTSIKSEVLSIIQKTYPTLEGENQAMSTMLQPYQLGSDLISFLREQGASGTLFAFKITVSYDGVSYLGLVKGQLRFSLSGNLTRIGLTVIYSKGLLNVVGVFTN